MSTAYHPQSYGQAEKANATLETFLKDYILQLKSPEQWSQLLPLAEFTYNAAKQKATGMLPFEADIGYIPRLPLDLLAPGPRMPNSRPGMEYAEWLVKILRILRERIEEAQFTMVTETNEHRQLHLFRIGDSVFLDTRLLPVGYANVNSTANDSANLRKFQQPYAGPFTILRSAGKNAFDLDIPAHWRLHPVFNVTRLKLSRFDRTSEHPPPPPLCSTATVEYEVETLGLYRIRSVKTIKGNQATFDNSQQSNLRSCVWVSVVVLVRMFVLIFLWGGKPLFLHLCGAGVRGGDSDLDSP